MQKRLRSMISVKGFSWSCFVCCVLLPSSSCLQLPACKPSRGSVQVPSVSACQKFVNLLEDPQYCSLDQGHNCCVVLDATITSQCHCWPGFSGATLGLISLLQEHCADKYSKESLPSLDITVFIGVLTGSANAEQRHAVRKTWALEAKGHRVVFFSAVSQNMTLFDLLRREAAEYQDVVVLPNIHESYFNITHQTLEMCRMAAMDPAVTHLLKVDDDSYVHVTKLIARLKALPREKMFAGYMEKAGGKPHRDPANRWHVPVEEWPWETYPAWAHGAGYVITKDLVHEIAAGAAMKIQNHTLFRLEDISMGAWVEYVSKEKGWYVQLVKDKRFNFNGCLGTDLVSHYIQAQQMRCMYENNGKCCIGGKLAQSKGLTRKGIT